MKAIDIFYQGEGLREIDHIEMDDDKSFGALKAAIAEKHDLAGDVLFFLEDRDEPVDDEMNVREHCGTHGIKAHLHRCRHVEVAVTYNGETVRRRFGPGTTVARVKRWAAERKLGMSRDEASEHVLQLAGTHERPTPGTHLGALTACPHCRVVFQLVPDERVNGHAGGVTRG